MSSLRVFINISGSSISTPNLFCNILTKIRNYEMLRLTSLIILVVSTADI